MAGLAIGIAASIELRRGAQGMGGKCLGQIFLHRPLA
ncbi:hypothetical protein YPPY09_0788, partial [Yersinia pestis PY-09]